MSVFSLSGLHVLYVEQCTVKRRQSGSASSSPLSHREPLTGRGGRATQTPSRWASPRGKRPSSLLGALPALSVFLLTCDPPGCSPKDSAAGAAAAAAGRVDLRKTEGTRASGAAASRPAPRGTFPLCQNFGSGEVGGEGRCGRAGGGRGARGQCPAGGRLGAGLGSSRPAGARLRLQPAPLGTQAALPERGTGAGARAGAAGGKQQQSPHAGGRLVAARGAPNFIAAKVRGFQLGLGCWGGGAWGAGAGEEGTVEPALSGFMERFVCVGDREQQPSCSFIWRVGIWVFRPRGSLPSHPPPLTKCAASRESAVLVPE